MCEDALEKGPKGRIAKEVDVVDLVDSIRAHIITHFVEVSAPSWGPRMMIFCTLLLQSYFDIDIDVR